MSNPTGQAAIDSVLKEHRVFPPPEHFSRRASVPSRARYDELYRRSVEDPEGFWGEMAGRLRWTTRWERVLDWQPPFAKWFVGGRLNIADNCLDRHLAGPRRNKAAIVWEGEPGDRRVLTYHALHREVCRFANVLKALGVRAGDRVGIYLPMVPEAAIAMLACARIGAIHGVVFGGFSAEALRDRMNDAEATVLVTADGGYRRGAVVPLKANVDEALAGVPTVRNVVVVRRTGEAVPMAAGRDHWWHELVEGASPECVAEPLDSEHPLFVLYTSGTTGKPKGIVHTTGGYLLHAALSAEWVFDLKEEDTYWCTADIGWVTGHSYVVYGILANGATSVMYEGAPNHPAPDRFWRLVEDLGVTVFYTAPTAIRAFVKWGEEWPRRHDLSSLRLLGTVVIEPLELSLERRLPFVVPRVALVRHPRIPDLVVRPELAFEARDELVVPFVVGSGATTLNEEHLATSTLRGCVLLVHRIGLSAPRARRPFRIHWVRWAEAHAEHSSWRVRPPSDHRMASTFA